MQGCVALSTNYANTRVRGNNYRQSVCRTSLEFARLLVPNVYTYARQINNTKQIYANIKGQDATIRKGTVSIIVLQGKQ